MTKKLELSAAQCRALLVICDAGSPAEWCDDARWRVGGAGVHGGALRGLAERGFVEIGERLGRRLAAPTIAGTLLAKALRARDAEL